jgi:putative N6-adenine-specific DNA methylase
LNPQTSHLFFASCPRGLEALLAEEMRGFGAADLRSLPGGVSFRGSMELCWRANLGSRLASRVMLQLLHKPYKTEQQVYDAAYAIDWPGLFAVDRSLRVDVNAIRCPLKSLDFITLRIKDAVCDRFRAKLDRRPDVDTRNPDVRIHGFLDATHFTLYLDTSGEPLYKRGWRTEVGEAPLKENLAAGIVMLSGWDRRETLYDPMCGSGTLLIEAAMLALNMPPGARREFGFQRLAGHDAAGWATLREAVLAAATPPMPLEIYGSDSSPREVDRARENLEAAGLKGSVVFGVGDVLEMPPPASSGVMIANPPYGVRLGEANELAAFYPPLGNALKARYSGWRCYLFSGDPELAKLIRLRASKRTPLFNGPLECRLYEYRMQEGSLRKPREGGAGQPDGKTPG